MTGKRILALLMAGILLLSMVSCGSGNVSAPVGGDDPTRTDPAAAVPSVEGDTPEGSGTEYLPSDPITGPGAGEDTDPAQPGLTVEDILADKRGDGYQIEADGTTYTRRSDVAAYLVIGVDKAGTIRTGDFIGGQCDVLMVLAVDNGAKKFTLLQLHRDSMVDVDLVDYYGGLLGITKKQQICFSHTYGSGDEKSCENTVRAVSRLLGGLKIDGYVSLNYGAVTAMNEAVGGVSVRIEDEMTNVDPAFVKGETVLLTGDQALKFVRARMTVGDGTNTSRMRRQRTYLSALAAKLRTEIKGTSSIINDVYNAASPYMISDMSSGAITNIGAKCLTYTDCGIVTPKGESKEVLYANGNYYVEHYVDEENLQDILISLFYAK